MKRAFGIALISALGAASAFAATQTEPFSWSNVALNKTSFSIDSVPGFDDLGGTLLLTKVELIFSGSVSGIASLGTTVGQDITARAELAAGTVQIEFSSLTASDITLSGVSANTFIPNGTTVPGVAYGDPSITGSNDTVVGLGAFINGGGPISLLLTANASGSPQVVGSPGLDPGQFFVFNSSFTTSGEGSVVYTYEAVGVPEAGTTGAALGLAGLVGFGCYRRFRKS